MKFLAPTIIAVSLAATGEAFSLSSTASATMSKQSSQHRNGRFVSTSLKRSGSSVDDEVAKLKEAAAQARAEAARLAKVR